MEQIKQTSFVRGGDIKDSLEIGLSAELKKDPTDDINELLKSMNPEIYSYDEGFSNIKFHFVINSIFKTGKRMNVEWYRNEGYIIISEIQPHYSFDDDGDTYEGRRYEHKLKHFYSVRDLQELFNQHFNINDWVKEIEHYYSKRMNDVNRLSKGEEYDGEEYDEYDEELGWM